MSAITFLRFVMAFLFSVKVLILPSFCYNKYGRIYYEINRKTKIKIKYKKARH
jgi:hypothetical protein